MRALRTVAILFLASCTNDSYALPANATAIDGDTIATWDGRPNIRLAVIDAPELPGHCRTGRRCVEGDPYAAQRQLQRYLNEGWLVCCDLLKLDYYGRRLMNCYRNDNVTLSNLMLASGTVGLYERDR